MNEWHNKSLKDIINFNPRENIQRNTLAKKIAMEKIKPFTRFIEEYEISEFRGGSKFINGDTLLARITPCLENGKTAQVDILNKDEVGFGSTEFIVLRGKKDVSDNGFIYYLASSDSFRKIAIQSMVGSSGRQRVQKRVLENTKMMLPSLSEQKAISKILSSLDEKIRLNNNMNCNLEHQLKTLFEELFAQNICTITDDDSVALGDIITSIDNRGKTPPLVAEPTPYPIIDVKALSGNSRIIDYNTCTKYVAKSTYDSWFRSGHPQPYDILISTVGSLAEMKIFLGNKGCIAQNVVAFRCKDISPLYIYQYLNYIKSDLIAYNIGSVQPSIKVTHIIRHRIYRPAETKIKIFHSIAETMTNKMFANCQESEHLISLRDSLLAKLMSGEIRVQLEEV